MTRAMEHPPIDVPILNWWHGVYDHVFVALHPFYGIPAEVPERQSSNDRTYEEILSWHAQPDEFEDIVKARGEAITWAEVHRNVAPETAEDDVYRAIWLLSCIGYQKRANISLQKRIVAYCEPRGIYFPAADGLPAVMEDQVARFLLASGADSVTAWDEFRDNSFDIPVPAFGRDQPPIVLPRSTTSSAVWGISLDDPGLLLTWQFDGTEALVAMTDQAFQKARPELFFEGWYVREGDYSDVFNPKDFFKRRM